MDQLTRYNILEAPLPERLRLRDLFGGFCSVLFVITPVLCLAFVAFGWPFQRAIHETFVYAYFTAYAVCFIVWCVPIVSLVSESLIRQRIYAGAYARVSLFWNATYGFVLMYLAYIPLWANPATRHYLAQREVHGLIHLTNVYLLCIGGGFVLAWLLRALILALSTERSANAVFREQGGLAQVQAPTLEDKIIEQYEPLKVPKWPMSS